MKVPMEMCILPPAFRGSLVFISYGAICIVSEYIVRCLREGRKLHSQ